MFTAYIWVAGSTLAGILLGAGLLHAIPMLGSVGRRVSEMLCRAPLLDLPMTYFTVAPLFAGAIAAGWIGVAGAVTGQVAGVLLWIQLHELFHRNHVRGPRIVKFLNGTVGRFRNHAALWVMAPGVPVFWMIRVAQIAVYPPLTWLVGLPKYRDGDYVNLSRQKFRGLVGHDLIWCLYCDWMTGLWSLGSDMLRNIESLWCPIRFDNTKKCANCVIDFPDVVTGWAPADGTMADVTGVLEREYGNQQMPRAWFGHPTRITVKGKELVEATS